MLSSVAGGVRNWKLGERLGDMTTCLAICSFGVG